MIHHIWQWILNFTGTNNGDNSFATHMYNFWSGFGGNVSVLALAGTLVALYRHYGKTLRTFNPLHIMKAPIDLVHKKDKSE